MISLLQDENSTSDLSIQVFQVRLFWLTAKFMNDAPLASIIYTRTKALRLICYLNTFQQYVPCTKLKTVCYNVIAVKMMLLWCCLLLVPCYCCSFLVITASLSEMIRLSDAFTCMSDYVYTCLYLYCSVKRWPSSQLQDDVDQAEWPGRRLSSGPRPSNGSSESLLRRRRHGRLSDGSTKRQSTEHQRHSPIEACLVKLSLLYVCPWLITDLDIQFCNVM